MATEIELKAHIEHAESLRQLLSGKAEYLCTFKKEDTYYYHAEAQGFLPSGIRLRTERRAFPDGSEKSTTLLTYKRKKVKDGVEVNDEREFEIRSSVGEMMFGEPSSSHPAAELGDLLKGIGFEQGIFKRKHGWAFCRDDIIAELLEVESLGWFLELEIVVTDNREERFAEERNRLLDFYDSLELAREAIESRFYSEMLKELEGNNVK